MNGEQTLFGLLAGPGLAAASGPVVTGGGVVALASLVLAVSALILATWALVRSKNDRREARRVADGRRRRTETFAGLQQRVAQLESEVRARRGVSRPGGGNQPAGGAPAPSGGGQHPTPARPPWSSPPTQAPAGRGGGAPPRPFPTAPARSPLERLMAEYAQITLSGSDDAMSDLGVRATISVPDALPPDGAATVVSDPWGSYYRVDLDEGGVLLPKPRLEVDAKRIEVIALRAAFEFGSVDVGRDYEVVEVIEPARLRPAHTNQHEIERRGRLVLSPIG